MTPQPDPIVGRRIVAVRPLANDEMESFGWDVDIHGPPVVAVLDDGTLLVPGCDAEGNGAGCFWVRDPAGHDYTLISPEP